MTPPAICGLLAVILCSTRGTRSPALATRPSWNGQGSAPVVLRTVQLTHDRQEKGGALATDGSRLYFSQRVGERVVVMAMPTSGGEPEIVPLPVNAPFVLDVSPDGSEMLVADGSVRVLVETLIYVFPLYRVRRDGGVSHRVGDVMVHGASWLPDGRTILCGIGRHLKLVDGDGRALRTLATVPGIPGLARAAPDGRCIRLWVVDQQAGTWSLWEMAFDGKPPRQLLPGWDHGRDGSSGSWSPAGDYFFVSGHGGTPGVWVLPGRKGWFGREAAPARLTTLPMTAGLSLAGRDGRRFFLMAGLEAREVVGWDAGAGEFVPNKTSKRFFIAAFIAALVILVVASVAAAQAALTDKEQLGKVIFFEYKDLSLNGNQSCATCHAPQAGWTGDIPAINEHGGVYEASIPGAFGDRKPPSSGYATFSPILHMDKKGQFVGGSFWDGRATGEILGSPAAEQAKGPFLNQKEQALPDAAALVAKVCAATYEDLFRQVWGADICELANTAVAYDAIGY